MYLPSILEFQYLHKSQHDDENEVVLRYKSLNCAYKIEYLKSQSSLPGANQLMDDTDIHVYAH